MKTDFAVEPDRLTLINLYWMERMTAKEVAKEVGLYEDEILRLLRFHNINLRDRWKGDGNIPWDGNL